MKLKSLLTEYVIKPGKLYVIFSVPYEPNRFVEISDMNEVETVRKKYSTEYDYLGVFKCVKK